MRSWIVVMGLVLAACPSSSKTTQDAGSDGTPMVDASTTIDPVTVAFTRVGAPSVAGSWNRFYRAPDGTVYAIKQPLVGKTTDAGLSWSGLSAPDVSNLAATPTALFGARSSSQAAVPSALLRSTNGGVTWSAVPILYPLGPQVFGRVATTGTTLWVLSFSIAPNVIPTKMQRSVNDGASFTDVPLPGVFASYELIAGTNDKLYLIGDGHAFETTDGSSWTDLGYANVVQVVAFADDALIVVTANGPVIVHRRPAGSATWIDEAPLNTRPVFAVRPNGKVVRVWFDGTVDESATDGAAWTPLVTATSGGKTDLYALDEAVLAYDARLPTGATMWTVPPAPCLPGSADVSFASDGTIVAAGTDRVMTSRDQGMTWRCGTYALGQGNPITSIAMAPDQSRLFVASTLSRYLYLDVTGDNELMSMTTLGAQTEYVRASQWISSDTLLVTTSTESSDNGDLWELKPNEISGTRKVYPYHTVSDPMGHPSAGFWGVGECAMGQTFGWTALSSRRLIGPNNFLDKLFVQPAYGRLNDWTERDAPFPGAALSIACGASAFVLVYRENHLYISGTLSPVFHELVATGFTGTVKAAKIAPDDHLWLVTDQGLFRSTAAIQSP